MPIHRKRNISYYTFPALDKLGVVHGIFMRHGGCSPAPWASLNLATSVGDSRESVIENRNRITETLNLKKDSIYDVWQVHSNNVIFSTKPRELDTPHKKADAIITDNKDVTLLMLFADCVPIILYDQTVNIAAIAHAGWKGTINKVVANAVISMIDDHGCRPEYLTACIGPSICVHHYAVGDVVLQQVKNAFIDIEGIIEQREKIFHLNLQVANEKILLELGIVEIYKSSICTACNTADWFSHREESGNTGRFAALITCK